MSSQRELIPLRVTVAAAVGLSKCGIFYFPDPFAIIMVDAGQGRMTSVIERTMDPYWSESFDFNVHKSSVITVQVYDKEGLNKHDQGFLGVANIKLESVVECENWELGAGIHEVLTLNLEESKTDHQSCGKVIVHLSSDVSISIGSTEPSHAPGVTEAAVRMRLNNLGRNPSISHQASVATTSSFAITSTMQPPTPNTPHVTDLELQASKDIGSLWSNPEPIPFVIQIIRLGMGEDDIIRCVPEDEAQTSIDALDKVLETPDTPQQTRKKYIKLLYKMCGHHILLPTAMQIPISYDRKHSISYRGGFADVWKGEHCGRDVAVKVVRTYSDSNLQKILGKFCKEVVVWKTLHHPNVLPLIGVKMSENEFAMISDWMANGNINDFIRAHPGINRITLLEGVAKGLVYIHDQEMIHGDLKGANIVIDDNGNARLADFGLLTIISDPINLLSSSSCALGGTARWMSPELIDPQRFGLDRTRPTKSSDYYALAMVIYETITGRLPFHEHTDLNVFVKVLNGDRPRRGPGFADNLWKMLELCWASESEARPSATDVLQCLVTVSELPLSPAGEETWNIGDDWDSGSDPFDGLEGALI